MLAYLPEYCAVSNIWVCSCYIIVLLMKNIKLVGCSTVVVYVGIRGVVADYLTTRETPGSIPTSTIRFRTYIVPYLKANIVCLSAICAVG